MILRHARAFFFPVHQARWRSRWSRTSRDFVTRLRVTPLIAAAITRIRPSAREYPRTPLDGYDVTRARSVFGRAVACTRSVIEPNGREEGNAVDGGRKDEGSLEVATDSSLPRLARERSGAKYFDVAERRPRTAT